MNNKDFKKHLDDLKVLIKELELITPTDDSPESILIHKKLEDLKIKAKLGESLL